VSEMEIKAQGDAAMQAASKPIMDFYDPDRISQRQELRNRLVACISQFAAEQDGLAWQDIAETLTATETDLQRHPITFVSLVRCSGVCPLYAGHNLEP
jgi:hypothetical protein